MADSEYLKVAKQAALEAGEIIRQYAGKIHKKTIKNDDVSDFATEADIEAEKAITTVLTKAFPDHNIIAEEDGTIDKKSNFTWVVDPLDGSFSFETGVPFFSVSIGLLEDKMPVLGVILNVTTKEMYWAQKDKGAFLNDQQIHVSSTDKLNEAAGVLDFGHIKKRQSKLDLYINPLLTKVGYPYSFGSAVAVLGMVGQGILDLDINQAWVWDFVAGAVIVRESGGKITDFEGNEPDWTKERLNIIASNGLLHDQILNILKNV